MMFRKQTMAVMVGLAFLGLASGDVSTPETSAPLMARLDEVRSTHHLGEGEAVSSREVLRGEGVSAHLVQVHTRVRLHLHREHEETVYLLEGSGIMVIGKRAYPIQAGTLMIIPRGIVHSYEARQPTVALSIFDPPFDGEDRHFVDTGKGSVSPP